MNRGLPKWPQMLVFGRSVSVEQAKEIIRRTDTFFTSLEYAGNDRDYCLRVMKTLGIPIIDYDAPVEDRFKVFHEQQAWRDRWGYIETQYVHNSWIASAFIFGPHGWCSPTGRVVFTDNIGKWPSEEDVLDDWSKLAKEFPFLDLYAVLMDREQCEEEALPVVGFRVYQGEAAVFDPCQPEAEEVIKSAAASIHEIIDRDFGEENFKKTPMFDTRNERGIDWSWIEEWAKRGK